MTLAEIIANLKDQTITIDSVIAELTRQAYYDQYANWINTGQYIPILNFNIVENSININNTETLSFTSDDIFTADDWICINQNNA